MEFAQSSIDPVSGRMVPLAACARLGVDGSHEPTVRPTANEIVLSTLIRPGEAGSNCWWQKIAMNNHHAAFLSRLDLLSNTKGAW